jgi:Ras-related protein Rab-22
MADNNGPKVPGCKVVLVGESAVGKTCIISRFISGAFDSNVSSTNGASYASKNVQYDKLGKNLLLDVWDTAGQEKYRALTKFFYKDAKVAILVYDITRYDTFKSIKEFWYEQVKENGPKNIVIGIAGNKCDLYEKEEVNENEAREFAASIGAIFALTSAQNNSGISELFRDVGNKYLDPNFQQQMQIENEEKNPEGKNTNIVLDQKEENKPEKKKKSFC